MAVEKDNRTNNEKVKRLLELLGYADDPHIVPDEDCEGAAEFDLDEMLEKLERELGQE